MKYQTEFNIQQLRTKNLVKSVQALTGFVGAVVANMVIPQLLLKYIYDPTTLMEAPAIFELLPLVTYSLALIYFLYTLVSNFTSEREAKKLEREMNLYSNDEVDDGEITQEELKELEAIVEEALKPKKKTKKVAKKSKKTVSKKTKKTAKK